MSECKETKVEYLDEKAKSYKKDKPSRRPNASVSVVPRNQFSLNDLRRGKVNEVVRPTTQNKLKLSSEPKSTECVVKEVKKDMLARRRVRMLLRIVLTNLPNPVTYREHI